jgi:hypothetical protein
MKAQTVRNGRFVYDGKKREKALREQMSDFQDAVRAALERGDLELLRDYLLDVRDNAPLVLSKHDVRELAYLMDTLANRLKRNGRGRPAGPANNQTAALQCAAYLAREGKKFYRDFTGLERIRQHEVRDQINKFAIAIASRAFNQRLALDCLEGPGGFEKMKVKINSEVRLRAREDGLVDKMWKAMTGCALICA